MVERSPEDVFEGFITRFEKDVEDLQTSGPSGRGRVTIREKLQETIRMSGFKLDIKMQILLFESFAKEFVQRNEYDLADMCYAHLLDTLQPALILGPSCTQVFKTAAKASIIYNKISAQYKQQLGSSSYSRIAPIAVTKLLVLLTELRVSMKAIFEELPAAKDQEEVAWLVLNGSKLILKMAQPLVLLSCGRYVTETVIFASVCMEAVVNLCTCRHLKFRMKLYTTAFYSTMAAGSNDDSDRLLKKMSKELAELRDREYLDPPVPEKVEIVLIRAETDLAVMRAVHHFWANPDALASDLSDESALRTRFVCPAINNDYKSKYIQEFGITFTERVLSEFIRVHQLTSGNVNETFRRRTASALKGFHKISQAFPTVEVHAPRHNKHVHIAGSDENKSAEGTDKVEEQKAATITVTDCPLSVTCLLEILCLSQFEDVPEGTSEVECPLASIQANIFKYVETKSSTPSKGGILLNSSAVTSTLFRGQVTTMPLAEPALQLESDSALVEIGLVRQIAALIALSSQSKYVEQLVASVSFVREVDRMLYSPVSARRRGYLRALSLSLWKRGVYPLLQRSLSDLSTDSLPALKVLAPTLVALLKTLDLTKIEDPLLLGALSVVTARINAYFGDHRGAIALLLRSMETMDEHRAARVDLSLHMPVDSRDVHALQRSSFSAKSEAQDWYHSIKRLGAHAFAGFGIFGASSQAERTDAALAELHTDMTVLYFRFELEYCIERKHCKHKMKSRLWTKDGRRVKADPKKGGAAGHTTNLGFGETDAGEGAEGAFKGTSGAEEGGMPIGMETMVEFDEAELGDVKKASTDQLTVVPLLKAWCERNTYARALLSVELARAEKSPEKASKLLLEACRCVDETEQEEELLKASFSDLTILSSEPRLRAPLIVARSHKFIYTVPVGSKALQDTKHIDYYRIFCKEEKNNSLVTLVNDEMDGCEKRIAVSLLNVDNQLCECVSRIGNVRWGQKYVFASGAFDSQGKNIGSVGPTSLPVGAVNPLPNMLIWTYIYQAATALSVSHVRRLAAAHVSDRFFLVNPNQGAAPLSIGKGTNMFVGEYSSLCMLAVQQSSPVILASFVEAFLALADEDKPGAHSTGLLVGAAGEGSLQGMIPQQIRRKGQWQILTQLRRTAAVAAIACYSQEVDLIVKCIAKGYELASALLFADEPHLGGMLQNPILVLLIALQSVPKRHWHELEHKLYCRLLHHALKLSISNRSTASVVPVINRLFDDADHGMFSAAGNAAASRQVQQCYSALESLLKRESDVFGPSGNAASSTAGEQFDKALASLIAAPAAAEPLPWHNPDQSFLWRRGSASAVHAVLSAGRKAVLDGTAASVNLKGRPNAMSDLLVTFVALVKVKTSAQEDKEAFAKASKCLPVYDKLLAPEVLAVHNEWQIGLVEPLPELPKEPEAPAPAPDAVNVNGTPTKKVAIDPLAQYSNVTKEEAMAQFSALAEICALRAERFSVGTDNVVRNYFPDSVGGPEKYVDVEDAGLFINIAEAEAAAAALVAPVVKEEPVVVDPKAKGKKPAAAVEEVVAPIAFGKLDYLRYMGAAVHLYSKGNCPSGAISAATRLWNFIVDHWISPDVFAREFVSMRGNMKSLIAAVTDAMKHLLQNCGGSDKHSAYEVVLSLQDIGDKDNGNKLFATQVQPPAGAGADHKGSIDPSFNAAITPATVEELMSSVQNLFGFMLKVQWLYRDLFEVVSLGSPAVDCYLSVNKPALCKSVGDVCLPLITKAQVLILEGVEADLATHKHAAEKCEEDFVELMKKKRRKKTRVARVEKDEDDIMHEAEMEVIQRAVFDAESRLEYNKERARLVKLQRKRFDTMFATGVQLLNKVRSARIDFLASCRETFGSAENAAFGELVQEHPALTSQLDDVLDQYDQVANFLREKKDKFTLIEALRDQGDLLLLFGMNSQARNIWHDGLDGLFSAMDSYKDWKNIAADAVRDMYADENTDMMKAMLLAADILAKLSKYCAAVDWDSKSNYSRFSAELCRAPFMESYGHPVTLAGFAAYVCRDLGGPASYILSSDKQGISSLASSLEEVVTVLHGNRLYVQAFPAAVLLEHLHSHYTHRADLWLRARVLRIRLLIDAHFFAEAASMLAAVKHSVNSITKHTFTDLLLGAGPRLKAKFDTSENGLDFYGYAPFFNSLAPTDDKNKIALQWIKDSASELKTFLTEFQVVKKSIAASDSGSGMKEKALSVPLFPAHVISEMSVASAHFLVKLSLLDGKVTAPHNETLSELANSALALLLSITDTQLSGASSNDDTFPYERWIRQYCTCALMKCDIFVQRRQYMEARRLAFHLLEVLQASSVKTYIGADAKSFMAFAWLETRNKMLDIALRQYRLDDVEKLSTLAVQEASVTCNGFWIRSLLLSRAIARYRSGRLFECSADCDNLLSLYDASLMSDVGQLRCISLKSSVLRDLVVGNIVSGSAAGDNGAFSGLSDANMLNKVISLLRTAYSIAKSLGESVGFLGADVNVTFAKQDSNVSQYHYLPPLVHSLTDIHPNSPELTLKYAKAVSAANDGKPNSFPLQQQLRAGPVDSKESTLSPSEYVNVYLKEVRILADCHATLAAVLDEKREVEAFEAAAKEKEGRGASAEAKASAAESDLDTGAVAKSSVEKTLAEQTSTGENALKLLRHLVFASPHTRMSLLQSVGRARTAAQPAVVLASEEDKVRPFATSLNVAVASAHNWDMMRESCVRLAQYYYAQAQGASGPLGVAAGDPRAAKANMAKAVQHLTCGVKVGNQLRVLEKSSVRTLAADKSFSGTAPAAELAKLMDSTILCSSATAQTKWSLKGGPAPDAAVDPKAKGKAPAGAPAAPVSTSTARDAIFLLSSIMRDFDSGWMDTEDRTNYCDIDALLKKQYPAYDTLCGLRQLPTIDKSDVTVTVPAGSLSSLWLPTKTPAGFAEERLHPNSGRFSHVNGYFVLGGTDGAAAAPVLKLVTIQRADVAHVRKGLFKLKNDLSFALANPGADGDLLGSCAKIFSKALELLMQCFRNGYIDEMVAGANAGESRSDPSNQKSASVCEISGSGGDIRVKLNIANKDPTKDAASVSMPMQAEVISAMTDLLSCEKDTDAVVQPKVFELFKALLN